jgi:biotin carboxyl carrier protein
MLDVTINSKDSFSIEKADEKMSLNQITVDWDACRQPNGLISVIYKNKSYTAIVETVDKTAKEVVIRVNGQQYRAAIKEPIDQLLSTMGLDTKALKKAEPVKAPMPGLVLKILVTVGQHINKGDGLIILEAMKMENILKAAVPGVVKAIKVTERTAVDKGSILIEME